MLRSTVLEYRNYRYLKIASLLMFFAVAVYLFDQPATGAYGGTWLGYSLGILSTIIVVVLLLYGIRKHLVPLRAERRSLPDTASPHRVAPDRREHEANWLRHQGPTLQGWLSAHIYLGIALIVLATLHTGFQFGWNVHTLSYALMMVVIISGCYGTYTYLHFPSLITENMGESDTFDSLLQEIDDLDRQAGVKSLQFSDDVCALVLKAQQETLIGGNFFQQLTGFQRDCPTSKAVQKLQILSKSLKYEQLKPFDSLYLVMAQKETLVKRVRRDVMYRAKMGFWVYFHTPFAIAFLSALIAHIVAIFFYG
ncbi:MAG TPA: hypothetical protein VMW07_06830 [Gallionella sp.]|jgi:hypothetical protein|nr:hypothetical protein [Gallionella sp.]